MVAQKFCWLLWSLATSNFVNLKVETVPSWVKCKVKKILTIFLFKFFLACNPQCYSCVSSAVFFCCCVLNLLPLSISTHLIFELKFQNFIPEAKSIELAEAEILLDDHSHIPVVVMADYFFTIFYSRTLTNFSFSVPRCSPQIPCIPLPALSFDNPKTARRRKKKSFNLSLHSNNNQGPTLAVPSSSNLDIVSSHELSDGSVIFRFGDPSEVAKDDVSKESKTSVEVGGEGKEEYRVVKVLDGEYEREVIVKRIEREEESQVLNKAADVANSMEAIGSESSKAAEEASDSCDNESSKVTEKESESCDKLLEDPNHAHFPFSASNTEAEKIEREEGSQGSNEVLDVPTTVAIGCESNRDTDGVSQTREMLLEEPEHVQLPVSTSSTEIQKIGSESSNVTYGVSESSEKLLEDPEEVQLPVSVTSTEFGDSSSSVVAIENNRHAEEILSTVSVLEKSNELETGGTYGEVLDKKYDNEEVLQSVSLKSGFDTESTENNRDQEHTLKDFEALGSSIHDEDQDVLQNVPKDSSKSNAIEVMPLSPLREAVRILDEEAENDMIQEFGGKDTTEKLPTMNNNLPNRTLEAERSSNHLQSSDLLEVSDREGIELKSTDSEAETSDNKFPISDLPEASDHVLIELKTAGISLASRRIPTTAFVLSSAAALLPHPSKVLTGGEDAYFISQNWLGVADGVGQWSLEGTNPGVYAQELMDNCEKIVSDGNRSLLTNPEELLKLSVAKSQSHGLSTILVGCFDGQVLHIANIGDSGFIILRNGAVHKRSSPMFHEFCFPIQIERSDDPSQLSQGYQVELDEDDIAVLATNGLFDNLYEQEIASIVSKSHEAAKGPKEIAKVLATMAQEVGSSASARSPFADAAQAAGYAGYTGGKLDDVAVVVSMVQKAA